MASNDRTMTGTDWSTYERQVCEALREHFPRAQIQKNARIKGRFSKRMRQIDVLIMEEAPIGITKVVVEAKLYKRKLNVKDVDAFAGFVDDVGADRGLLLTNTGYTRSAFRRAYYGPRDLELDVLTFAELQRWQAFGALPYVDDQAFLVPAPFGWVVDANRIKDTLCTMYQRGLDTETAQRNREFVYINAWDRRKDSITVAELDRLQLARLRASGVHIISVRRETGYRWKVRRKRKRRDTAVRIRYARIQEYKALEVTGFIEFRDFIFFAVLLTPIEKRRQNVRRLRHVLESTIPIKLKKDNSLLIESLVKKAQATESSAEQAKIFADIGHWYRDMKKFDEAKHYLEHAFALQPSYYGVRELILVLLQLGKRHEIPRLLEASLLLDLKNPTVYNDALAFARSGHLEAELRTVLEGIEAKQKEDSLEKANCLFYIAQLLVGKDLDAVRQHLLSARSIFKKVLSPKHQVFEALKFSLQGSRQKP